MDKPHLISIDPGKDSFAWAKFTRGSLVSCGMHRFKNRVDMSLQIDQDFSGLDLSEARVVIEMPQIYRQRHWKGDPNDLLEVNLTVGMVTQALLGTPQLVKPSEWKGGRPKKADNEYTLLQLKEPELKVLRGADVPRYLWHNVIDAVGIGLWRLDRR